MVALAGATDGARCACHHSLLLIHFSVSDGRISLTLISGPPSKPNPGTSTVDIRYHLLNPAPHFKDVVDEARSVVIAGGTMSPVSIVLLYRKAIVLTSPNTDI